MPVLLIIILATLIVSLLSLVGILFLKLSDTKLDKILFYLIGLSAGALMGGAFLHLIPESLHLLNCEKSLIYVLLGFILFFLIEKILHWRHCHNIKCTIHTFTYMNLIGDAVHNFIDGLIIATSFIVDFKLGLITTLAIILHEIPQEIGDFGVLIYGGLTKKKALMYNLITALTAIMGGLVGFFLAQQVENFVSLLLPIAGGGFIYIAACDLIPEIKKETNLRKSILNLLILILGILILYGVKFIAPH
ncbi:MAG: ZIP family metal transporter [Patescibacteria group bacterium]|nr:ZIP family metal transporter [Patescibacteria group bacterium]